MATKTIKVEINKKIVMCDYCSKEGITQKCSCCDKDICKSHRGYKYPYDADEVNILFCVDCWKIFPGFAREEMDHIGMYLNNCTPEDADEMLKPEFFTRKGYYVFENARESDSFIVTYYPELKEGDIEEIENGPEYDRDRYEYRIYNETGENFEIDKSLKLI